jgi:uncharacterized membrane protein YciS (DUF1049 family)
MVLLGLLLLAACVVVAVEVAISNTDTATFEAFTQSFSDMTLAGLFLLGCALGALALLGLWMIFAGMRRARYRHRETKHMVTETRSRVDELEDENEALRAQLDRERTATAPADGASSYERDTAFTRDRNDDGVADRSQTAVGTGAVYPDDPTGRDVDTPAYDETAEKTHQRGMLGRLRDR